MRKLLFTTSYFFLTGCGATLCTKGDTNQGLFFHYGSDVVNYVDISWMPTFTSSASFVKKLIVKPDGFLTVTSQKTLHCDNFKEMKKNLQAQCKGHRFVDKYTVYRYTKEGGYQEWKSNSLPESEWRVAHDLRHPFSKQADYHYKNCRYHLLGKIYMLLKIIQKV